MTVLLHLAFLASGFSALVFETLWFRQAGLAFGNSVWASSLVLSSFMAGSAIGNLIAARVGDRPDRPLRAYAGLEVIVGVSGTLLVYALPHAGVALAPVFGPLLEHPVLLNATRVVTAFGLLMIPSAAMGMTLPIFTRALSASHLSFGVVLGRLYGWNTLGAVAGVLATEFLLVARIGVRGTALCAAAVNLVLAVTIASLSRLRPLPEQARAPATSARAPARGAGAWRPAWPWLAVAGISGFCLLALEVLWFRVLLMVVHGHSEAFAIMLAVVLAGIAGGGILGATWLRRAPAAVSIGASLAFLSALLVGASYYGLRLMGARLDAALVTSPLDIARLAVPLMLPVSVLSGVLFTFTASALKERYQTASATAGWVACINTVGGAAGSLAAGFLLLPLLGMERSLFAIALVYAAAGALLLFATPAARPAGYVCGTLAVAALAAFPFGTMRDVLLQVPLKRLSAQWGPRAPLGSGSPEIAAVREGTTDTVTYFRVPFLGRPLFHVLWNNAVPMADTEWESRRYMKEYVYWPLAVHPGPRRALLIAYGVGNTAQALTESRTLASIDVVDISKDVLDMSRFVHAGADPLQDPRVDVHVEDGRFFLQTTQQRYDLITSEPPPPASAGVVNLYTLEYFRLLREHLNEGGVVAYWLPIHALSDRATQSIIGAFCQAFADCSLWHGIGTELMLVGTQGLRGPVSDEHFARQWRDPAVLGELSRLGLERPEQLGALFIGDAEFLAQVAAGADPVVDDFPKRIARRSAADGDRLINTLFDASAARTRFQRSALIARLWPRHYIEASLPYFDVQARINAYSFGRSSIEDVYDLLTRTDLRTPIEWLLGSNGDAGRVVDEVTPEVRATPVAQYHLGIRLLAERRYDDAAPAFARAATLPGAGSQVFGLQMFALAMAGRTAEAQQAVHARIARIGGSSPQLRAEEQSPFWRFMRLTFGIERR